MRNITKILLSVMCAGILLSGIGTGIAIAEYTSLEYTGRHILGEANLKQENIDTVVVPVEGKKILISEYYMTSDIVYDDTIPMNTIRFSVKYNPELIRVGVRYEEAVYDELESGEETQFQGTVRMNNTYLGNGFDLFMEYKDRILSDLKQGKIGSYEVKDIENLEIWMNPQMKESVELGY